MRNIALVIVAILCSGALAGAQGITAQQAEDILKELRAMRAAIDKLAAQQTAPTRPGQPSGQAPNEPVKLADVGSYIMGSSSAPVTIVEFTDLQCPFCNRFATQTFEQLKKTYIDTGQVRFITRDLPLGMHQHAMRAAKASRCAGEQGKFWEMRTTLVRNATTLSPELMTATAQTLKLDMAAFDACVQSTRVLPCNVSPRERSRARPVRDGQRRRPLQPLTRAVRPPRDTGGWAQWVSQRRAPRPAPPQDDEVVSKGWRDHRPRVS